MRDKITGKNKNKKTAGEPARGPISQQTQQVTPTHSNQAPTSSSAEEEATKYLRTDLCFDHWARVSGTCEDVMRARMSLTIRERFIKVAMGKLLDAYKKQKDGPKDVAGLFFPNMRQDAKDWANEGKKLESLCKGLYPRLRSQDSIEDQPIEHQHLGLLYFLPLNIPKEM
ncbi:hypothetical protein VI817_000172 [Penicillium citrinum]|nr:hypothetical protein VI817_000172 [Penicillium citrinum]